MKAFKMAQPKTLSGARSVLGDDFEETLILAGGTDLVAMIKEEIAAPSTLVNLKGVQALKKVESKDGGLVIGALVTLDELANHGAIKKSWPAVAMTIKKAATPQVRNSATVAGNLCQRPRCSYFRHEAYTCLKKGGQSCPAREGVHETHAIFDNGICNAPHVSNLAPVLMAYDAMLEIAGKAGVRRVAVEDFFVSPKVNVERENVLGPDEILTAIVLPKSSAAANAAYSEARQKQSYDWALAGATARLDLEKNGVVRDARIIVSAVAPTPIRRPDLEAMLKGKKLNARRIDAVAEASAKGATPLRDNSYKTMMLKAVMARALRQAKEA